MKLSVIIATRNRAQSLCQTLQLLAKQIVAAPVQYEVIVVDNGSTDMTAAAVESLAATYPVALHYFYEPRVGKGSALNRGIEQAHGEVLVFTDDDTNIGPDWLQATADTFMETQADGVGGPVYPVWLSPPPTWLSERLVGQLGIIDHGPQPFVVHEAKHSFIGPNAAYRRELFVQLGGYDPEDPMEDSEWFLRVQRHGFKLVYQPAMRVGHRWEGSAITQRWLAQRLFRCGRGCARGLQRTAGGLRLFRIPLWVLRLCIQLPLQALLCRVRGQADEARWHWLRRNYYTGVVYWCFSDWMKRRPAQYQAIPRLALVQEAA